MTFSYKYIHCATLLLIEITQESSFFTLDVVNIKWSVILSQKNTCFMLLTTEEEVVIDV